MPNTRQLVKQRKLNLMANRRAPNVRHIWFIGKRQSGFLYYLAEFDDNTSTAMWSKHQLDAIPFKTEVGIHQFISSYLNNRTDLVLVQVDA